MPAAAPVAASTAPPAARPPVTLTACLIRERGDRMPPAPSTSATSANSAGAARRVPRPTLRDRLRQPRRPGAAGCRRLLCARIGLPRLLPRTLTCGLLLLAAGTSAAHAGTGGSDLPWNHPLQVVVDNLTGPTAKTVAALAFVLGGAMWMFTSHEQGAKRFGQALFGVAIVLGAVNLVDALGFQGAIF
jgi:type IV secretory pathway VirB2 component (pilin)